MHRGRRRPRGPGDHRRRSRTAAASSAHSPRQAASARRHSSRIRRPLPPRRGTLLCGIVAGKTAFILGGGASRGAYQAGCLKRLEEEGIVPDLLIGSSIGVCNSLVYATGGAEALWGFWSRAVALPQILDISLRRNALTGNSFFSMGRLQRFVESEVDFEKCFESETELSYVVTNVSEGREEMRGNRTEPDVERFRTVTRIGYAIPILHPLIELDGDMYADGGFLWNVPFEYAEEWGATDIYVLSVVPSRLPRTESLRFIPQVAMR